MRKEENYLKNWFLNSKPTDIFFIQLTLALAVIGLIFAFSSSTYESHRITNSFWSLGLKQLAAFILGSILLVLFWKVDYKFWYKATWYLAFIMLGLMIVTVFSGVGKVSGGSTRWIDIGVFQFQPAEVAKFAVILLITKFLTKYNWYEFKNNFYYLVLIAILIFTIFKQPDLGSAIILILLVVQLLFIFGLPIWILFSTIALGGFIGSFKLLSPYQLDRIKFWLNPYLEPQGRGYNLIQAQYAFGIGNIYGVGLGNSIQKQGHLPVPHADFILAVIAEEIGFIGLTAILILYLTWILRGMYLVNKIQNKYGRILGTAIIFLISIQAIVNISVAVGLLPITGVTLPFFSCGGTSLIVTLSMCGILFNIISSETDQILRS